MEKLAAFLAYEVHLFFATAGACIAVLQLVVVVGADNLYHARFFESGKIPVYGAE
jgi:hypothetical protein